MSRSEEAALLRTQIAQAQAETPLDCGELASLAGLLQRLCPTDSLLVTLAWVRDVGLRFEEPANEALAVLAAIEEDDDASESWDALCALDELSAAATFVGRPEVVADVIGAAARLIRAFPEPWAVHGPQATELLQARAPLRSDPAWRLWAAVEAAPAMVGALVLGGLAQAQA